MTAPKARSSSAAVEGGLAQVCRLVQSRLGIEIRDPDRADNRLRLERLRSGTGCADWWQLAGRLIHEPTTGRAWSAAISNLTVGETYFFRHRHQFDHLRQDILAPLITERRREPSPWLRLWSAGCSTGEEAYSLAILVREMVPDIDRWNVLILATDVNQVALEKAAAGCYGTWSFREPREGLKEACFTPEGHRLVVRKEIRRTVTFAPHNLLDEIDEGWVKSFDVILCRNVTLYFPDAAAEVAIGHLHDALRPGGSLLVGPAEPRADVFRGLELVSGKEATSYRRPERKFAVRAGGASSELPSTRPALDRAHAPAAARAGPPAALPAESDVASGLQSAWAEADAGHHQAAIEHCIRTLELEPGNAEAYFLLGSIYGEQRDPERAVDLLRQALYLEPDFALAHFSLGHQLRLIGDLRGARLSLRAANHLLSGLPDDLPVHGATELTAAKACSTTDLETAGTQG